MFDPFSPRIFFPVSALLFLLAGILGVWFFPQFTIPFAVVLLQFAGIALFLLGTFNARRLSWILGDGKAVLVAFSLLLLYFSYLNFPSYFYLALLAPVLLLYIRKHGNRVAYQLMAAGAILFLLNLYSIGLPLLDPGLRDGGYSFVWTFSVLLFLLGYALRVQVAAGREIFVLSLVAIGLLVLGGYRGPVILVVVSALACAYHRKLLDLKKLLPYFLLLIVFVAVMGWFIAKSRLDPVQLLFHRAAYTNWVGGLIISGSPVYGVKEGGMWLEANPRFGIGEMFLNRHRSITGGFFGSLWFDSGIIGLVAGSFLLGAVMQALYLRRRFAPAVYWLMLAYLLLALDNGLDFVYLEAFLASLFFVSDRSHR